MDTDVIDAIDAELRDTHDLTLDIARNIATTSVPAWNQPQFDLYTLAFALDAVLCDDTRDLPNPDMLPIDVLQAARAIRVLAMFDVNAQHISFTNGSRHNARLQHRIARNRQQMR